MAKRSRNRNDQDGSDAAARQVRTTPAPVAQPSALNTTYSYLQPAVGPQAGALASYLQPAGALQAGTLASVQPADFRVMIGGQMYGIAPARQAMAAVTYTGVGTSAAPIEIDNYEDDGEDDAQIIAEIELDQIAPLRNQIIPLSSSGRLQNLSPQASHLGRLIRLHVHIQRYRHLAVKAALPSAPLLCQHITSVANNVQPTEKLLEVYIAELADIGVSSAELQQFRQAAHVVLKKPRKNSSLSSNNSGVILSAADFGTERAIEDMLKDDYSGLVQTAADGEFPRIVAELYEYSTELEEFGTDDNASWETPFASFAVQLWPDSGIAIVYVRQGLLSTLLGHQFPDRLTQAIRELYRKAKTRRLEHPHLYNETVLLSGADELADALRNAALQGMLSPQSACQPCLDARRVALSQRCEVVGCTYSFRDHDRSEAERSRQAHMKESHGGATTTPLSHVATDAGLLVLSIRAKPETTTRMITDTTLPYKLPHHYMPAGGSIDNPQNVVACLGCCVEMLQSEVENHMSQSPGCRPCSMAPICAGCEHRGFTCGTNDTVWAQPFCSADLVIMTDDDLEAMLASYQVKGIPEYAATTVQHAIVKRQQMRAPIVPTEARPVAALVLLCAQITDYQAVDVDTLLALARWTRAARVEHSLAPLESSHMTRREWESTLRAAFPREKWPEDAAFGSLSTNEGFTGVELRFVVRNKMVSIARQNGIALFEGRMHDVLRYCHLTMPFTNGFAPMPPETVQRITDSSARGEIQAVGCFMRTSNTRHNDVAFDGYREENLVLIARFEQGNLVDFSPVKVTAQRLDRKGTDSIACVLSDRQSRGERECVLEMGRLRNAHPRGQPIYLNLIVRGPGGLTATQDQYRRWAGYWETEGIFVTLYVNHKVVHRPIVNAASLGARDPNSPYFDQKVHDFGELNNVLAQGKHNGGRRAQFEDLLGAWVLNQDRNIV
ncbi:hypothetical protein CBER1_06661 [Cercospora berteroae]|uniref:Uncharacterized protein n=1 Tax=Cercospora berteroae TaxID=357750 RepID=A0A2S6CFV0_9PEZI|nr:hypothetical protein CBER1_06661 [Cercospora berteroae]